MPELPEVETVVNTLRPLVSNKKIKTVKIFLNKLIKQPDTISEFKKIIENQKINNVSRVGKHIVFELDRDVLISHLRMEGKYYFLESGSKTELPEKHILCTIKFEDGSSLYYHDTRRFGTMHLQSMKTYKDLNPLKKVGLEPWDKKCTIEFLHNSLARKKIAIKSSLLDQTIMSGLGNIYVNEVLHLAKINPTKSSSSVTKKELGDIINLSKKIMKKAIKLGGSSISSYTSSLGVTGKFQNELVVHMKKDEKCTLCKKEIIKKMKVNGRGTYYCPNCQK